MPTLKHETHDIPQILAHLPLFLELVPEQLAHIASHTREKRLQKGEMLFQKGDAPRGFYVIVFGQIKLAFPSSQGNEKVINILGKRIFHTDGFGQPVWHNCTPVNPMRDLMKVVAHFSEIPR